MTIMNSKVRGMNKTRFPYRAGGVLEKKQRPPMSTVGTRATLRDALKKDVIQMTAHIAGIAHAWWSRRAGSDSGWTRIASEGEGISAIFAKRYRSMD